MNTSAKLDSKKRIERRACDPPEYALAVVEEHSAGPCAELLQHDQPLARVAALGAPPGGPLGSGWAGRLERNLPATLAATWTASRPHSLATWANLYGDD